jgi:phosphatidate cytidylyltransferase
MSGDASASTENAQRRELRLRIGSAVVMATIACLTLWLGGWPFAVTWTLLGMVAAAEWVKIVAPTSSNIGRILAACGVAASGSLAYVGWEGLALLCSAIVAGVMMARLRPGVRLVGGAGVLYASAIAVSPIIVRTEPEIGFALIGWCFAVVWSTDVAAYFVGRAIGGPKLWPAVSPKKTWSGAIGGAAAGIVAGVLVAWITRQYGAAWTLNFWGTAACALLVSAAGQMGDLLESSLKRHFGVKDSGSIIPGHGGVLDRLDAFVVVVTLVAVNVVIWR